jgi:hypothetical protein
MESAVQMESGVTSRPAEPIGEASLFGCAQGARKVRPVEREHSTGGQVYAP